jgi:MFS transporter, MHS family, proline/betaine transporter
LGVVVEKFSLVEELLLLTLEDRGGEFDRVPEVFLVCGIIGGALIDLSLRDKLDSDLTGVWAIDATPTGDPVLDGVLAEVAGEAARLDPRAWIVRLSGQAMAMRETALQQLCTRGVLRKDGTRYLWTGAADAPRTKTRIFDLLFSDIIPAPEDVALIAMADACFVFERIIAPAELAKVRYRIRQLCRLDLIGAQIALAAQQLNLEFRAAERKTVLAGLAGNILEWYDFGVYGFFAAAIGTQFFPAHDPTVSLIASFGVFAIGFLARPIGAAVFGHVGDKLGRRTAVISSVVSMAVPTCLMAVLPTYAQIGVLAPVLLILLRLAQGLAVGGEFTTSMVMLAEHALPSRRGHVSSFAPFGAFGGLLLGSALGWAITDSITPEQAALWGWRLAFVAGLVIGVIVYLIRRRLPPEPVITAPKTETGPLIEAFRTQKLAMLQVIGFNLSTAVGFYLCFVFTTTWLRQVAHVSGPKALLLNSIGLAAMMAMVPFVGSLSDRFGRKRILFIGCIGLIPFSVPLLAWMGHGTVLAIVTGQFGFALLLGCFIGASPGFLVEAFPKHVRCSGLSVGYNLSMSLFGGTVPMIAVWLMTETGNPLSPAWYLAAVSVISVWMTAVMRRQEAEAR